MRFVNFLLVLVALAAVAFAQTAENMKPSVIKGDVASVSDSRIVLQTENGAVDVMLSDKTIYKRVPPENPNPAAAVASNLSEIAVGDKLTVTGFPSADKKSIPARSVYLITKSDIAQKQTKDQEQWKTRGISGQVSAINPQTKEITVSSRGMLGETKTVVTPKDNAKIKRYAQDSNDYNQAKASSIDEIKVGDSVRALGDKSADNLSFKAEEIVSGSFQTIGGTITAIDAAKNEITINNIQTKKSVTVVVGANSVLKRFPPEMAQRMAAFQSGGGAGIQPPAGMVRPPSQPNAQANAQGAPSGARPMGAGGGRAGGIDEMLERFPAITITDLKVGDMIAFSSTKTANQDRVTAIKLLAGVEPFLKMAQAAGANQSSGRRGADSGFSIPGLEGGGLQ